MKGEFLYNGTQRVKWKFKVIEYVNHRGYGEIQISYRHGFSILPDTITMNEGWKYKRLLEEVEQFTAEEIENMVFSEILYELKYKKLRKKWK